MNARGSAGYLLLEVLLCPSGCSGILHSSWVAEAGAASEQVKGLGRIGKMAMKKERETVPGIPVHFALHSASGSAQP